MDRIIDLQRSKFFIIFLKLFILNQLIFTSIVKADFELPLGSISNCPFIQNDKYDISSVLETIKAQIATELEGRKSCKQELQRFLSSLSPLQDFYKTIDQSMKYKITHSVYANALSSLSSRKVALELKGDFNSLEYQNILNQIYTIESSNLLNAIDLQFIQENSQQDLEAYYRNQLLKHTSHILNIFGSTAKNRPECAGKLSGWEDILSTVLSGASVGAGLGLNPTAQILGAAAGISSQLVSSLQDSKIRKSYNDLIKLKNYKTLACTYYTVKKTSCEYQRAYLLSKDQNRLREYIKNKFRSDIIGEYERFFVNQGRIVNIGSVFSIIAQMGSPLTLDSELIQAYLNAKSIDFEKLGPPPSIDESDEVIKSWLIRAKAFGVSFRELNYQSGEIYSLKSQLQSALKDIENKKAVIQSSEKIMKENLSFLDLRRRLSAVSPHITNNVIEMISYFERLRNSDIVMPQDKPTLKAAESLLIKLKNFLLVTASSLDSDNGLNEYEREVISIGGLIFQELAKGSVAQLNTQSVLALSSKGTDRISWAFGAIRNGYLVLDQKGGIPLEERFSEYQKNHNFLSDVIANYNAFYGSGTTFRNEDIAKAISSFEGAFYKDIYNSLELSMDNDLGWKELRGKSASHLCALYSSTLSHLSTKKSVFGNKAEKLLKMCKANFKELELNGLVSQDNFKIDYANECSYFDYTRETEMQNLLSHLLFSTDQL